jgi:mono/diheme cytochrome c family protein
MSRTKAIVAILCAAALAATVTFVARQKIIDSLAAQNASLKHELQQAQTDRKAAINKANARETELEGVRHDSVELARLRDQMKSNPPPPAQPTGFYIGTDKPVFITYGTSDPLLRSFVRALMDANSDPMAKGQAIFEKICAACHQPDGMGKDGVAPPLVGSEWVVTPGGQRLARIVLNGLTGPITVRGREWNLPMPPWRENLDDDEVAVVLTYIRANLGSNKAGAIKPETVTAARQDAHPGQHTAADLQQISPD